MTARPSEELVLDAFAAEPQHDRATLERYLRDYPEHGSALAGLSFELNRTDLEEGDLDEQDQLAIAKAWSDRVAVRSERLVNPLSTLDVSERRDVAKKLGVKMQVLILFRQGGILIDSVPAWFQDKFAGLLRIPNIRGMEVAALAGVQSYKSSVPPKPPPPISFEEALRQSGATEEEIAALMKGG